MFIRFIPLLCIAQLLFWPQYSQARGYSEIGVTSGSTIEGHVLWDGEEPPPFEFEVNRDEDPLSCADRGKHEQMVISIDKRTHGIFGALVYLKDIRAGAPLTTGTLDSESSVRFSFCSLLPRLIAMSEGARLQIVSQEDVIHQPLLGITGELFVDELATVGMAKYVHMKTAGFYPVRCRKHPWEYSMVVVLDHPYYNVTGPSGEFTIPNVPAGSYTLEVWHPDIAPVPVETNGLVTQYQFDHPLVDDLRVQTKAGDTQEVEFVLPASGRSRLR